MRSFMCKQVHQNMRAFRWEDLDHSLVRLRLAELSEELRAQSKTQEKRIEFENRGNFNQSAVPSLMLEMKIALTDTWIRRMYEIYCQVWQVQGYAKSAFRTKCLGAGSDPPSPRPGGFNRRMVPVVCETYKFSG
jgi:hypothetical protein